MRLIHVAVAAFALGISSAHAGEIIDFSAKILDIKGGEIPRENPKPGPDGKMLQAPALTLADVCEVSLLDDGRSASRGQPMQGRRSRGEAAALSDGGEDRNREEVPAQLR